MGFADLLPSLTLEETLNLNQHRVFRAVLRLLLQEINALRAFDSAVATDVFLEINRRRAFDAAIVADLLQRLNELRALMDPSLPALTENDLAAKAPRQAIPDDFTAKPRPQLTVAQVLDVVKALL